MKKQLLIALVALLFFSCSEKSRFNKANTSVDSSGLLLPVLFHQQAAEMTALLHQAYNVAADRLTYFQHSDDMLPPAIVFDIDETILDNSPYEALCVLKNTAYPEYWHEWCMASAAEAVEGALGFTKFADSLGFAVFYITNRKKVFEEATIANLKTLGFPNADPEHCFFRTNESSKESRRAEILENYHIVMLVGDNLADFSNLFDDGTTASRKEQVQNLQSEFGRRFIVLPNVMYGNWLQSLVKESEQMDDETGRTGLKSFLNAFEPGKE